MLAQGYNWSKWARLKSNTKISFVNGGNRILKCLDLWDKYTKWITNIFKSYLWSHSMIYFHIYIGCWISRFQFHLLQNYIDITTCQKSDSIISRAPHCWSPWHSSSMNNDTVGVGKSEVIASDEGGKLAKILKSWSSNLKHLSSEYSKVAKNCIYLGKILNFGKTLCFAHFLQAICKLSNI